MHNMSDAQLIWGLIKMCVPVVIVLIAICYMAFLCWKAWVDYEESKYRNSDMWYYDVNGKHKDL